MIQVSFSRNYYFTHKYLKKIFKDKFERNNKELCAQQAAELAKIQFNKDLPYIGGTADEFECLTEDKTKEHDNKNN